MRIFRITLITMLALCCQFIVKAHGGKKTLADSVILGNITDIYSKKPISDVTVLLSSGKQQSKRDVRTTDASGAFLFPQIRPGEFTLQFEKKGYKTYKKEGIMVKDGIQLKLSLEAEDEDSGIDSWNPLRMLYSK